MRIGLLHQYSLLSSGSGVYGARVIEGLLRLGHDVVVVCRSADVSQLPFVDELVMHEGGTVTRRRLRGGRPRCTIHCLRDGIAGVSYPREDEPDGVLFTCMSVEQRRAYLDYQAREIASVMTQHGVEVMHANHEVPMSEVARLVEQATGIPYVVVAHGSTIEYVHKPSRGWRSATRRGLLGARSVIALNAEGRDRLLAVEPSLAPSVRVSAVGVDTRMFRPSRAASARPSGRLAFVGRLSWEKGLHLVLAALPSLASGRPGLRLDVIGDGDARGAFEDLLLAFDAGDLARARRILLQAAEDGAGEAVMPLLDHLSSVDEARWGEGCRAARLRRRVRFTGHLAPPDVARQLREADLLVVPSLVKEAYPLVVLEALSCGVIPCGSDRGGLPSVLSELEHRLAPLPAPLQLGLGEGFGVDAIVRGTTYLLDALAEDDVRADVRRRCRDVAVEHYDWNGVAARLEESYEDAIDTVTTSARLPAVASL
jgi:glycosyltransferase involved in cell wall biosynthesis